MTGRGAHVVDAMLYLARDIDSVVAQSHRLAQDFGVDDTTSMLFRFKSGVTGYLGTVIATGCWSSFRIGGWCRWCRRGIGRAIAEAFAACKADPCRKRPLTARRKGRAK